MEVTPERRIESDDVPRAPKKPPRRRALSEIASVSNDVKRRLVFDADNGTVCVDNKESVEGDKEIVEISGDEGSEGTENAITHCVHTCVCTPSARHLLCCELVSLDDSVSVAKCPFCERGARSVPGSDDSFKPTTWSDENCIVSPFPGLKCYVSTFDSVKHPVLLETGGKYLPVYAPRPSSFCKTRCHMKDAASSVLLGKGSFGKVLRLRDDRTALKVSGGSIDETLLNVWISGVVRARAQDAGFAGDFDESVYCNILVATGSCLQHNLVSFAAFDRDMYNYRGWHFSGLPSYRRAFTGIADGLRFLNLRCGIAHFDITPMNFLINVDPSDDRHIERAVICDFSLSQYHGDDGNRDGRCVVVFEETKTVRALTKSTFYLTDIYHPAFKPLYLQKLCTMRPRMQFPNPTEKRLCVADLCALGNVVAFCLVRVLDERGQFKVRMTSEDALFSTARKTCDALARHCIDDIGNMCSLVIPRQLAYFATVLGSSEVEGTVSRLCDFFAAESDEEAPERFRIVYKRARGEIDGSYMIRLLQSALKTDDGRYLVENVRRTCLTLEDEDLDKDPYSLFP